MIFDSFLEAAAVGGISIVGIAIVVWAGVRFLSEWKRRREIAKRLEQVMMDLEFGRVFQ